MGKRKEVETLHHELLSKIVNKRLKTVASASTTSNLPYGFGSQYSRICLLITGKNRQNWDHLPYLQRLISGIVRSLSGINARERVNFRATREEFSLRKLGLK